MVRIATTLTQTFRLQIAGRDQTLGILFFPRTYFPSHRGTFLIRNGWPLALLMVDAMEWKCHSSQG